MAPSPERFHFVTVVWGERFTDAFLKVILPNNLSPGNLPSFQARGRSCYRIFTTREDAARIEASPIFAKLARVIRPELVVPAGLDFRGNKYEVSAECHRQAIRAADDDEAALVFLAPDLLWADGTFATIGRIAATGKRLVAACGLRVVRETFLPALLHRYYSPADLTLSVPCRELVKLSLQHLHPISRAHLWDSRQFAWFPALLYWKVADEGILARAFHLHPLMVNPHARGIMPPQGTIDAEYVRLVCPDPDDICVMEDSDEIFLCDLTGASETIANLPQVPNSASLPAIAAWAREHTNDLHRRFVTHRIRIHTGASSPEWEEAERFSDVVVETIHSLLEGARCPESVGA
jgi:hypothetical protein